jgi:haloalkane dehalogenase
VVSESWRALYPFQSRWFDRGDGVRMHYVDEGAGDPVVLVHGNPTWSFYWRDLAKALVAAGHRVVMMDHVGMGLSDKPADARYEYTLRERLRDMDRLLGSLSLGPVTLIVHDWGGAIGLGWALRDPARVKALVITNTAGFLPGPGHRLPWQLALARGPLGALVMRGLDWFSWGLVHLCSTKRLPDAVKAGYRFPYSSWERRVAVHRFVQDIPRRPGDRAWPVMEWLGTELGRLREKPILLAWGLRDFVFTPAFLAEFKRRMPEAEVREYPDANHLVLEDAAEDLIPRIVAFAARQKDHASRR